MLGIVDVICFVGLLLVEMCENEMAATETGGRSPWRPAMARPALVRFVLAGLPCDGAVGKMGTVEIAPVRVAVDESRLLRNHHDAGGKV